MLNKSLTAIGKLTALTSKTLNRGSGSTWPGHIALSANKNFIKDVLKQNPQLKTIVIVGTNGKTTTGKLIQTILEKDNKRVFQNEAGANLLNGIASSLLLHSSILSTINYDYAIFEVDENSLPGITAEFIPDYVVVLNLFRDQLDRYGEVDSIAKKWKKALRDLPDSTVVIANGDDPLIAQIAQSAHENASYFGLDDKKLNRTEIQHASDTTYCPNCGAKLHFKERYLSHLGNWECTKCNRRRPQLSLSETSYYPLSGLYNKYNALAAILLSQKIGVNNKTIEQSLQSFTPAFGRQEKIEYKGKNVQIFLSKNPTSFNESLRTINELKGKNLLLVLNDLIPDGRDISWIYDIDFETLLNPEQNVQISGDRTFDMALRIKYADFLKFEKEENLEKAVNLALEKTPKSETLYILPTYSAMLEVRKLLTGKKIL